MADDKTHKEHNEALLRSLLLVLMDNASAEYAFLASFFKPPPRPAAISQPPASPFPPSPGLLAPSVLDEDVPQTPRTASTPGFERTPRPRRDSVVSSFTVAVNNIPQAPTEQEIKETKAVLDGLWKQILDPVLEYTQVRYR
jgi:vacuolar protein sorting-associated protein 52